MQTCELLQLVLLVAQLPWLQLAMADPVKPAAELVIVLLYPCAFVEAPDEQLDQLSVVEEQLLLDEQLAVEPPFEPEQVQE